MPSIIFTFFQAVKLIVEDALLKFSADRTGLPDYALESAGSYYLIIIMNT